MLTALVLRERGFSRMAIVSRNEARGERAAALGLPTMTTAELERGELSEAPTCVFDCAGTPASARLAIDLVRPVGQVMLVGISLEPLDLAAAPLVLKEVALRGVLTYRRDEFAEAIALLAAGRIPADELITAVAPLEQAEAMFQALTAPGNDQLKVILQP